MKFLIRSNIKKDLSNLNKLARKKLVKVAKLSFSPEQAKIGPALAQLGISSMEFCERFNFQTRGWDKELLILVKLNVFSDKSFSFSLKPFSLRDLTLAFDLDLLWLSSFSKLVKNSDALELIDESKVDKEFLLSLYRSFLIFKSQFDNHSNFIISYEQFIKLFFSYLKSYQ